MTDFLRYSWQLLLLSSLLVLAGILLLPRILPGTDLPVYIITVAAYCLINLIAGFIMLRGANKKKRDGIVVLLAGIGGKFLLYLLYILLFWLITKNITKAFILTFFALYLVFTFFIAAHLLKILKNK